MKKLLLAIALSLLLVPAARPADIPITNVVSTLDPALYYNPSDGTFPDGAYTGFIKINTNILSLLLRVSRKADTNAIAELQAQINSMVAPTNGITAEFATNIFTALIFYATNQLGEDLRGLIATKANTNSPTIWGPNIRSGATLYGNVELKAGLAGLYFGEDAAMTPAAGGLLYTDFTTGKTWRILYGDILANGAGLTNLQSTNLVGLVPVPRMGVGSPSVGWVLRALNTSNAYWAPFAIATTNILLAGAPAGKVIKSDGTNWVAGDDYSSDPGALGGWLTNWQTHPVAAFSSPSVGYALGWDGTKWTPMNMDQAPPFVASTDHNLFVNALGSPYQRIGSDGKMAFSPTVTAPVFEAATGFRGKLHTASGEYPLYDNGAGAPILYYDGTTVSAVSGKKFGGDGSLLTSLQWSVASSWTSNANSRVLPNGNGYFGAGAVSLSDEGVISVYFQGNGSGLTSLNAGNLASGTVPTARLSGITSNQVASSTDLIYRNTPRVLEGSGVTITQGTDASGHTTYTVNASSSGGTFNYELTETTVTTGNSSTFDDSISSSQFGFYDYTIFVRTASGEWHWDKEHRSVVLGAIDEANDYVNFDNASPGFSGISISASYASGNFRLTLSNSSGGTCYWRVFGTKKVF